MNQRNISRRAAAAVIAAITDSRPGTKEYERAERAAVAAAERAAAVVADTAIPAADYIAAMDAFRAGYNALDDIAAVNALEVVAGIVSGYVSSKLAARIDNAPAVYAAAARAADDMRQAAIEGLYSAAAENRRHTKRSAHAGELVSAGSAMSAAAQKALRQEMQAAPGLERHKDAQTGEVVERIIPAERPGYVRISWNPEAATLARAMAEDAIKASGNKYAAAAVRGKQYGYTQTQTAADVFGESTSAGQKAISRALDAVRAAAGNIESDTRDYLFCAKCADYDMVVSGNYSED